MSDGRYSSMSAERKMEPKGSDPFGAFGVFIPREA